MFSSSQITLGCIKSTNKNPSQHISSSLKTEITHQWNGLRFSRVTVSKGRNHFHEDHSSFMQLPLRKSCHLPFSSPLSSICQEANKREREGLFCRTVWGLQFLGWEGLLRSSFGAVVSSHLSGTGSREMGQETILSNKSTRLAPSDPIPPS